MLFTYRQLVGKVLDHEKSDTTETYKNEHFDQFVKSEEFGSEFNIQVGETDPCPKYKISFVFVFDSLKSNL